MNRQIFPDESRFLIEMVKVRYTEDECILALELYLMLPRKDIRRDNPQIIQLSDFLTSKGHPHNANSIKMKLENFKAFDPLYLGKSLSNGSDMDRKIWERFYATGFTDLSKAAEESRMRISHGDSSVFGMENLDEGGRTKLVEMMERSNQDIFRGRVLTVYDSKCCITGIQSNDMIQACHIKPWSASPENSKERLDPRNGLCLNVLHHKAFDDGLFTLDEKYRVELSPALEQIERPEVIKRYYRPYEGQTITIDMKEFLPSEEYLDYHRKNVFRERAES